MIEPAPIVRQLERKAASLRRTGKLEQACDVYAEAVRELNDHYVQLGESSTDRLDVIRGYWEIWYHAAETWAKRAGLEEFFCRGGEVDLRQEWLEAAENQVEEYLERIWPFIRFSILPGIRMMPRVKALCWEEPLAVAFPLLLSADIDAVRDRFHAAIGRYRLAIVFFEEIGVAPGFRAHAHAGLGYALACLERWGDASTTLAQGCEVGDPLWSSICSDMLSSLEA